MNTREISRSTVDLTPKFEAEIRARTHIRPDAPNTKPGDVGNGHILVIDHRTQKFNGETYRLYAKAHYFVRFIGKKQLFLHKEVWAFHNGSAPKDCYVHHEHKDEHGQWDTSRNDIECLLLMKPDEHKAWHAKYHPLIELECVICHDTFFAKSKTAKYCLKCAKEVALEKNRVHRNKNRQAFQPFEANSTALTVVEDDIPRAAGKGTKVIRYCFFCKRAFETRIATETVSCNRPDCQGRAVANAYEQAKIAAHNESMAFRMKINGGFLKYTYKTIKKHIRCMLIDGEPWFVAKDAAEALGYKEPMNAVRTHVKPKYRKTIDRAEVDLNTGANRPGSNDAVSETLNRTEVDLNRGVKHTGSNGAFFGINREIVLISEAGFYRLAFRSKLPEAEAFTDWVTEVVLPSLRKFGQFTITEETAPPSPLPEDTALVLVDADDRPLIP